MSLYAMNEGIEVAALRVMLALQERRHDDVTTMLEAIAQHSAAQLASAVDDAWIAALDKGAGR